MMRQAVITILLAAASAACEPPPTTIEAREILPILLQTQQRHEDITTLAYATWRLPDIEIDDIDIVIQTSQDDLVVNCVVWAPPVLGVRQRGVEFVYTPDANNGLSQSLRMTNIEVSGVKRRDRLLSCGATLDTVFHGLRVHYRALRPAETT